MGGVLMWNMECDGNNMCQMRSIKYFYCKSNGSKGMIWKVNFWPGGGTIES